ncbi:MAG: hypothetical protein JXA09_11030, partial [Anaerolineae bacterium]|nr:hypothetical protein [Anaerolineae bacterium]
VLLGTAFVLLGMLAACEAGASPEGTGSDLIEQIVSPTPDWSTVEVDTDQVPDLGEKPTKGGGCAGLDSALVQIMQSPDPISMAQQLGIKTSGSKIQVALTLSGTDTAFLSDYDVEVGTQVGEKVQAYVPVKQLCEIALLDQVLRVSLPAVGAPQ